GGSIPEVARLGGFRFLVGLSLLGRTPSLYNAVPNFDPNDISNSFTNFVENIPLRNAGAVVTNVFPGATAIANLLDNREWAQQQIATFFTSDGLVTIDPDGAGPAFETPTSMVPEDRGF